VDGETRRVVGLEALVRWNHPTRGPVMPGQFIPVAEGVETEEPWASLRRQGCAAMQGYFLGRPQPAEAIAALLGAIAPPEVDATAVAGRAYHQGQRHQLERLAPSCTRGAVG
jgi:EAL domain-containing protein (putative c-di-GMP-specific phosphodiesterase class I)